MSNETKRNVFDELLEIAGNAMDQAMSAQYPSDDNGCSPSGIGKAIRDILDPIEKRYAAALPDDLPVIPKAVGVSIKEQKAKQSLGGALFDSIFAANELGRKDVGPVVNWMVDNDETYANAWLTGVWRVEETGEIVELEEEK